MKIKIHLLKHVYLFCKFDIYSSQINILKIKIATNLKKWKV